MRQRKRQTRRDSETEREAGRLTESKRKNVREREAGRKSKI